jgi:hypothetical protein
MKTQIYKAVINLDNPDINIDINVSLHNSLITTKNLKETPSQLTIMIQIEDDLCKIEDAPIWARPYLLEILGVLTFLTKYSFIVNDIQNSGSYYGNIPIILDEDKEFFIDGDNYLADFLHIEKKIMMSEDKTLFFSVIDRYRKILWFESNNDWANTYSDEIILTCVHILELITGTYYFDEQKKLVDNSIKDLINLLKENYFLSIKQDDIKSVIASDVLPLKAKVLFMLKKQGILTERLKTFIVEIIELRNAVAHGRNAHLSISKFPLPPFFSLLGKKEVDLNIIKNLVGRVIYIYFTLGNFQKEWKYIKRYLLPTEEEISNFINNHNEYEKLDIKQFYKKGLKGITPEILSDCLVKQQYPQKITTKNRNIQRLFNFLFEKYDYSEDITQILLYSAILLFQEKNFDNKDKCLEIIKNAKTKKFFPDIYHTSINTVIHYLSYIGHKIDVKELMKHI